MGEPIEKHSWNRELEMGLPDCRLRDPSHRMVQHGRMWLERAFCGNCGRESGGLYPDFATHFFYLCDECAQKNGDPPGMAKVPST